MIAAGLASAAARLLYVRMAYGIFEKFNVIMCGGVRVAGMLLLKDVVEVGVLGWDMSKTLKGLWTKKGGCIVAK